jgi:hypothetical protein
LLALSIEVDIVHNPKHKRGNSQSFCSLLTLRVVISRTPQSRLSPTCGIRWTGGYGGSGFGFDKDCLRRRSVPSIDEILESDSSSAAHGTTCANEHWGPHLEAAASHKRFASECWQWEMKNSKQAEQPLGRATMTAPQSTRSDCLTFLLQYANACNTAKKLASNIQLFAERQRPEPLYRFDNSLELGFSLAFAREI